jgi:hypothetical protein
MLPWNVRQAKNQPPSSIVTSWSCLDRTELDHPGSRAAIRRRRRSPLCADRADRADSAFGPRTASLSSNLPPDRCSVEAAAKAVKPAGQVIPPRRRSHDHEQGFTRQFRPDLGFGQTCSPPEEEEVP